MSGALPPYITTAVTGVPELVTTRISADFSAPRPLGEEEEARGEDEEPLANFADDSLAAAMKDDLTDELLDADGDGLVTSADILALRNRGVPASSIEAALEKMQARLTSPEQTEAM